MSTKSSARRRGEQLMLLTGVLCSIATADTAPSVLNSSHAPEEPKPPTYSFTVDGSVVVRWQRSFNVPFDASRINNVRLGLQDGDVTARVVHDRGDDIEQFPCRFLRERDFRTEALVSYCPQRAGCDFVESVAVLFEGVGEVTLRTSELVTLDSQQSMPSVVSCADGPDDDDDDSEESLLDAGASALDAGTHGDSDAGAAAAAEINEEAP
jgi:hypothetical protein